MIDVSGMQTGLFLDGAWVRGSESPLVSLNPATGEELTKVASAGVADVDAAVAAARRTLTGDWAAVPPSGKGLLLHRLADLVERDAEKLATLESLEIGTPFGFVQGMFVPNLVGSLRYYAGWADKVNGEALVNDGYFGAPTHAYTRRVPVGVVAAIVPWNAPLMILGWKLAPALATGNTVIVKPAEDASLSILHLATLIEEAGFPPSTVQVLPGAGSVVGEALATHAGVDKVSFTGSTAVGKRILRNSADTMKRTTLELGGKAPQIVFDDADLESAVRGVAQGLFYNQGEVCAAGTRILVHRSVYDDVVEGLKSAAEAQVLGDPFDQTTTVGPLINAAHREKVLGYVAKGRAEGATLVTGGSTPDGPGFFVQPTVFAGTNDHTIAREEIFGPVGTVIAFDDDAEAVRYANDSAYGLSATVWTKEIGRAHTVSAQLEAGAVAVNGWSPLGPQLPWGGMKASGLGRELGYDGILGNTETQTITIVL